MGYKGAASRWRGPQGEKFLSWVYPSIRLSIFSSTWKFIKHGIWTFLPDAGFIQVLMGKPNGKTESIHEGFSNAIFDYRKVSIRLFKMCTIFWLTSRRSFTCKVFGCPWEWLVRSRKTPVAYGINNRIDIWLTYETKKNIARSNGQMALRMLISIFFPGFILYHLISISIPQFLSHGRMFIIHRYS